jgi:hypothetical protein
MNALRKVRVVAVGAAPDRLARSHASPFRRRPSGCILRWSRRVVWALTSRLPSYAIGAYGPASSRMEAFLRARGGFLSQRNVRRIAQKPAGRAARRLELRL